MSLSARLQALKREIVDIKQKSLLSQTLPIILGASKQQPDHVIEEAIEAGLSVFGENRVQEAEAKWPSLRKHHPNVQLHLIGPLQTNKVKQALALFDIIQTIDRPALAEAIARIRDSGFGIEGKQFYIQVNTGKEPQKAGVFPEDAEALIYQCRQLQLPLTGLMCIPPLHQPPAPHFALLRQLAVTHGLSELSMGMSEDYPTAIRMGSTCIRLGRALFGERETK